MALVKTTDDIESIRGRFGGVYFKKDNSGQHIQAFPRSVRKASMTSTDGTLTAWSASRGMRTLSWTDVVRGYLAMTVGVYFPMWIYSLFTNKDDIQSKTGKPLNVYQWWMRLNMPRNVASLPMYTYPPKSATRLPALVGTGFTFGQQTINFYSPYRWVPSDGPIYYLTDHPVLRGAAIWWDVNRWIISTIPWEYTEFCWIRYGTEVKGYYYPMFHPEHSVVRISP